MVHFVVVCNVTRLSALRCAASCGDQPGYPDEVVGDQVEQEVGGDAGWASMFVLAHGSVLLAPPEDAFDHGPA